MRKYARTMILMLVCLVAAVGFFVFTILSRLGKERDYATRLICSSNLKQLDLAANLWASNHSGIFPRSILEMTNEIGGSRACVCPLDPNSSEADLNWNQVKISYEFLTPDAAKDTVTNKAVFRCPIHSFRIRGDGTVLFERANP